MRSGSLIPNNDPTLMFTNSGMVQFKNVFTGVGKRDFKTATTAQMRAGGKHNDLEKGYTPRHHTFSRCYEIFLSRLFWRGSNIFCLEPDYQRIWISKDKLCMTVYSEDDEAFNLWKKLPALMKIK